MRDLTPAEADLVNVLKAVADPTRLQLLALIYANPREATAVWLTNRVRPGAPTVLHHLRKLTAAGLVVRALPGEPYVVNLNGLSWLAATLRAFR